MVHIVNVPMLCRAHRNFTLTLCNTLQYNLKSNEVKNGTHVDLHFKCLETQYNKKSSYLIWNR